MTADLDLLREHLCTKAILASTPSHSLRGRNGVTVPWMFYSWGTTLTADGLVLAARCLVERLRANFRATQLAAHGFTAQPLLAACILESQGEYRGLAIRDRTKAYGSCRLIEGNGSRDEPVVVIDDSISSGKSLRAAVAALENEGYVVEGAICLVEFPWRGGTEWARALGYRVVTLFDVWRDLRMPIPPYTPAYRRVPVEWDDETRVDEALHPSAVVRQVAEHIQRTGRAPLPPETLDGGYRADGGVYVSFRETVTNHRIARDGFWHFVAADADVRRDLVLATAKTMRSPSLVHADLNRLKIGVTFLGALEQIAPAALDYLRYGIVVRSRVYPTKVGGALPNTQVFTGEVEQYHHARAVNAQIPAAEPHELFRHTIEKHVEPGAEWLPYGVSDQRAWRRDESVGAHLTARARQAIAAMLAGSPIDGEPLPDDLVPDPLNGVAVTLWNRGVAGCWITWEGSLDDCLTRAAAGALRDPRFSAKRSMDEPFGVSVSLLHDAEQHGVIDSPVIARKIRRGRDTVTVRNGRARGILLNHVSVHHNLDKRKFVDWALRKARIADGCGGAWSTVQTSTWLDNGRRVLPLEFGFPLRSETDGVPHDAAIALLGAYLARHRRQDGLPFYCYHPVTGREVTAGTAGRVLHAATALYDAGSVCGDAALKAAGAEAIAFALTKLEIAGGGVSLAIPDLQGGRMAEAQFLTSIARTRAGIGTPAASALARSVRTMLRDDGSISPFGRGERTRADHDFLPGVVLLALARFAVASGDDSLIAAVDRQFEWYRRRFRLVHPWGMVGWHPQAWAALSRITGRSDYAAFAFEIGDWALDFQHQASGAFLADLDPEGASFHTAFLAEGIAEAALLAEERGESERAPRYAASVDAAWRFLQELLIGRDDTFCMADPDAAIGGIRGSRTTSWVRIDFVSHTLEMLLKMHAIRRQVAVSGLHEKERT